MVSQCMGPVPMRGVRKWERKWEMWFNMTAEDGEGRGCSDRSTDGQMQQEMLCCRQVCRMSTNVDEAEHSRHLDSASAGQISSSYRFTRLL